MFLIKSQVEDFVKGLTFISTNRNFAVEPFSTQVNMSGTSNNNVDPLFTSNTTFLYLGSLTIKETSTLAQQNLTACSLVLNCLAQNSSGSIYYRGSADTKVLPERNTWENILFSSLFSFSDPNALMSIQFIGWRITYM